MIKSYQEDIELLTSNAHSYLDSMYLEAVTKKKVVIKKSASKKATAKKTVKKDVEPMEHETPEEIFDTKENPSAPDPEDLEGNTSGAEAEAESSDIDDIKTIISTGDKKRGKKPADYTIIKHLEASKQNKIVQYVGALLARSKSKKPYWTAEDIKQALNNQSFIDDKFKAILKSEDPQMEEEDMKRIAGEIRDNIFDNIAEFTTQVNSILKQQPAGEYKIPHEYTSAQLKSKFTAIVDAINLSDEFGLQTELNYNPEKDNMFAYMRTLIMELSRSIHIIKTKNEDEDDQEIRASRNKQIINAIKELNDMEQRPILLVDYEHPITNVDELEDYFKYVNSAEERTRGEKLVGKYKSKQKTSTANKVQEEKAQTGSWDKDAFEALLTKLSIQLQHQSSNTLESSSTINKIASEIAKLSPQLIEYIEKEYETEDGEGELAGLISKSSRVRDRSLGRKRNDVVNAQAENLLTKVFSKVKVNK